MTNHEFARGAAMLHALASRLGCTIDPPTPTPECPMTADLDEALDRIRAKCKAGALSCAHNTAYYRLMAGWLADQGDDLGRGWTVTISAEAIHAEFIAVLAEMPDAPVCRHHEAQRDAALAEIDGPGRRRVGANVGGFLDRR